MSERVLALIVLAIGIAGIWLALRGWSREDSERRRR